jgi:hypothetical protein
MHELARDQLERFRAAVDEPATGEELERLVADARKGKLTVDSGHEPPLKVAPRGYVREHPRGELIRWKGCMTWAEITEPSVLSSARLPARIVKLWETAASLLTWLETHVGPSTEPMDRRRAR